MIFAGRSKRANGETLRWYVMPVAMGDSPVRYLAYYADYQSGNETDGSFSGYELTDREFSQLRLL